MKYTIMKPKAKEEVYHLVTEQLTDKEYDELKPIVEHLRGHWREKTKCFVFYYNVTNYFKEALQKGIEITPEYLSRERTQFYPTPYMLAERVIDLAGLTGRAVEDIELDILEPSCGRGALLESVCASYRQYSNVVAIEMDEQNYKCVNTALDKMYIGYKTIQSKCMSFEQAYLELKQENKRFDRVIMNPPFAQQNDIKHLKMAYDLLKDDGTLVGVISENALYYDTEVTKEFLVFLKEVGAYIEAVPSETFRNSGTTIETVIIKIEK